MNLAIQLPLTPEQKVKSFAFNPANGQGGEGFKHSRINTTRDPLSKEFLEAAVS